MTVRILLGPDGTDSLYYDASDPADVARILRLSNPKAPPYEGGGWGRLGLRATFSTPPNPPLRKGRAILALPHYPSYAFPKAPSLRRRGSGEVGFVRIVFDPSQ